MKLSTKLRENKSDKLDAFVSELPDCDHRSMKKVSEYGSIFCSVVVNVSAVGRELPEAEVLEDSQSSGKKLAKALSPCSMLNMDRNSTLGKG